MSGENPPVSVVIVNFNGAEFLRPCLRSVYAQPYRPLEVIVVDNASVDGSVEILKREFPDAKLVALDRNTGFAEGNNIGVQLAAGEFIVLLNNDVVVEQNWISPLLTLMQEPQVAIVASKVLTDGVPDEFYEMNGSINYVGHNIMRQFADLSKIFYAGGTSLMFRRSDVGVPFLDEYFLYHEDVYVAWRMRLKGYDVRMAQASVVRHRGSATTKRQASALITYYQLRNRILNLLLFYQASTIVKLIPLFVGDTVASILRAASSKSRSLRGTLQAYMWLITHSGWIVSQRKREQAARRVPDRNILSLMSSNVLDEARSASHFTLLNRWSRMYARFVRLPFHG